MPFLDGICSPTMLYIVVLCVAISAGSAIYYLHTLLGTCIERVNRLHQIVHLIHTIHEEKNGRNEGPPPINGINISNGAHNSIISTPAFGDRVIVSDAGDGDDEYSDGDYSNEDDEYSDDGDDEYNSEEEGGEEPEPGLNNDLLLAARGPTDINSVSAEDPEFVQVVVNKVTTSPKQTTVHLDADLNVKEPEEIQPTKSALSKMTVVQLRTEMAKWFPDENVSKMNKTQLIQLSKTV